MNVQGCLVSGRIWRGGRLVDGDVTLDDVSAASRDDGALIWVDLLRPSHEALAQLAGRLGLGATMIEDALEPHERPKVTRHGENLFFTVYTSALDLRGGGPAAAPARAGATPASGPPAEPDTAAGAAAESATAQSATAQSATAQRATTQRAPTGRGAGSSGNRLVLGRISGLVLPHALVTIRLDEAVDLSPVLTRWTENVDLLRFGVGALLHGLLDTVVDGHFETIQALDDEIEDLEDQLFAQSGRGRGRVVVERIYRFRKDLVALRRVVLPMREVVNAVLRHRERASTELDHWYDDLYDHVLRAAEWTESLRDLATSAFETNLSLQDARLNTIMKKLAGWGAIIAIPTAVTGWFGMNVPYPGFSEPTGLYLSIALIVGLAGGLYLMFKRRDWL